MSSSTQESPLNSETNRESEIHSSPETVQQHHSFLTDYAAMSRLDLSKWTIEELKVSGLFSCF